METVVRSGIVEKTNKGCQDITQTQETVQCLSECSETITIVTPHRRLIIQENAVAYCIYKNKLCVAHICKWTFYIQ